MQRQVPDFLFREASRIARRISERRAAVERAPDQAGSVAVPGEKRSRDFAELDIDVLECPDCGGRFRFVAAILLSSAIRRILRHLGFPSDPVELAPARAPPELDDAWAC
jgi:uncharacterized protein (UPF0212 family)